MPLSAIGGFIAHAHEMEIDSAVWDVWRGLYPYMVLELIERKSLTEMRRALTERPVQYTSKTPEEIEAEMALIIKAYETKAR